ncbi:MAG: DinB family protein [Chloroflexi bacterium]|nr:DinB family protein [Chloroflexota bacterium]MCC6892665.1 DinB family protein [Anaerolineae bacterium]
MAAPTTFAEHLKFIQAARGLEAGGYYGLAKVMWALAYSGEIKVSNAAGIPRQAELDTAIWDIVQTLQANETDPAIINAIEKGWQAVREDRTIPFADIPNLYVSRTNGDIFIGEPPEITPHHDHWLALREFKGVWYFESMTLAEVFKALEHNPQLIKDQLEGLIAEQLLVAPAHGEWNMHQLLAHILMAQELLTERIELMLAEDNPNLASRAVWAQKDQEALSTGEVLERYIDLRQQLVERLKALPAADWWRKGWHDEFGAQTVLSQATYFTRHEMSHMPQFGQIRNALEG